jgi:hypothetical protein
LIVTGDLRQNLAALRSDGNIQPLPATIVSKYTLTGGDLAMVPVVRQKTPTTISKKEPAGHEDLQVLYSHAGPRPA